MDTSDAVTGWRKPRRSMANGNCVQAGMAGARVAVRDTRNPSGVVLVVTGAGWAGLTERVRSGAGVTER